MCYLLDYAPSFNTYAQLASQHGLGLSVSDWAAIATAVGTFALAIVAAFQDKIRNLIMRPRLEVKVLCAPPDCLKTAFSNPIAPHAQCAQAVPCYYFRIRVENVGNAEARDVEVYAASLQGRLANGSFITVAKFVPMNLLWANFRQPFLAVLSPRIPKHCDLAHVVHPDYRIRFGHILQGVGNEKAVLAFDLQVEPNMKGHLVPPGTYRMTLIVAAANARAKEFGIELDFRGDWYDEESQMLCDGFKMRLV